MRFPVFAGSLALTVGLAVACLGCGDDDGRAVVTVVGDTPTATATAPPIDGSATEGNGEPTATAGGDGGETPTVDSPVTGLLPCGDILVPLNKSTMLAEDCAPDDLMALPAPYAVGEQSLRAEAAEALVTMLDAATGEGHSIVASSTYRSYQLQVSIFQSHVDSIGQAEAERVSAMAGHSEHQLGTTADLTSQAVGFELVEAFGETPEGGWLREHSWEYGFIISYPQGSEPITGYAYEPWHVRYVGTTVAAHVHESGLTLHEYLTAAY